MIEHLNKEGLTELIADIKGYSLDKANKAQTSASAAEASAKSAEASAESAKSDAVQAKADAAEAKAGNEEWVNTYKPQVATAINDISSAISSAESAASNANTAAGKVDAVIASAEESAETAATASQQAAQAAQSSQTIVQQATTVIANAERQAQNASTAATSANDAASTASIAATNADTKATEADNAATNATAAAAVANKATQEMTTQASSDHSRAVADHTTASSDHTQAGTDHTTAGTDHTQAEADHTKVTVDWRNEFDEAQAERQTTFEASETSRSETFASKEAARDEAIAKVDEYEQEVTDLALEVDNISNEVTTATTNNLTVNDDNGNNIIVADADGVYVKDIKRLNKKELLTLDAYNIDYNSMTHVSVKADGTGDYTTIQDAINSITDASYFNQYCVDVYDDFVIEDIADLYYWHAPASKAELTTDSSGVITINAKAATDWSGVTDQNICLVATKNWVHVKGIGERKRLCVKCFQNISPSNHQYVEVINLAGNCILENFLVEIYGGRYAIHQDQSWFSGESTNPDVNATSVMKNVVAYHYGNDNTTSSWAAICAQANGIADGQKFVYINCKWFAYLSPYYTHTNTRNGDAYKNAPSLIFDGCEATCWTGMSASPFLQDLGCGQKVDIKIINSNIRKFTCESEAPVNFATTTMGTLLDNWWNGLGNVIGESSNRMFAYAVKPHVLTFKAKSLNTDIAITGGTAKDLIFGKEHKTVKGSDVVYGYTQGSIRVEEATKTKIWLLAWRIGNCATTNKTLVFNVGGSTYTMVFDVDYMGGSSYGFNTSPLSPYDTNDEFVTYMLGLHPQEDSTITFADLMDITIKKDATAYSLECISSAKVSSTPTKLTKSLPLGTPLMQRCGVYDYVEVCGSGVKCDAILAENFSMGDLMANIILADKAIFNKDDIGIDFTISSGSLIKWNGSNYVLTNTEDDACFKAIDEKSVITL